MSELDGMQQRNCDAPLVEVDIGLFADKVGVTTTNTLDLSQGVHDLALAINVGVEETQDVLYILNVNVFSLGITVHENGPGTAGGARGRGET